MLCVASTSVAPKLGSNTGLCYQKPGSCSKGPACAGKRSPSNTAEGRFRKAAHSIQVFGSSTALFTGTDVISDARPGATLTFQRLGCCCARRILAANLLLPCDPALTFRNSVFDPRLWKLDAMRCQHVRGPKARLQHGALLPKAWFVQ